MVAVCLRGSAIVWVIDSQERAQDGAPAPGQGLSGRRADAVIGARHDRGVSGCHDGSSPSACCLNRNKQIVSLPSGRVDFEAAAHGGSDCLQVVLVGTDHQVMATEGSFNHAGVHDVASRRASSERADRAGLAVIERFDVTPGQQLGQQSLAAPATPGPR
jgi:hypothetical protein